MQKYNAHKQSFQYIINKMLHFIDIYNSTIVNEPFSYGHNLKFQIMFATVFLAKLIIFYFSFKADV